jgi:hypothetical protein
MAVSPKENNPKPRYLKTALRLTKYNTLAIFVQSFKLERSMLFVRSPSK